MKRELISCDECGKDVKLGEREPGSSMSGAKPYGADEKRPTWFHVEISLVSHVCLAFEVDGPNKITGVMDFCNHTCLFKWIEKRMGHGI